MTVKRAKICLVCLTMLACALGIVTALGYGVYYTAVVQTEVAEYRAAPTLSTASLASLSPKDRGQGSAYSVLNGTSGLPSVLTAGAVAGAGAGAGAGSGAAANVSGEEEEVVYRAVNATEVIYLGMCVSNELIFSGHFVDVYQKIYAATFLFSFLIIAILYALIYRSILIRRAWKAKRKRMSCYASTANGPEVTAAPEETQLTNINNGSSTKEAPASRVTSRTSVALRDRMLYANIKTAAMLFVVTVVFIISFLPSWLIGLGAMPMNYILFYIFFLNNVANPFIYAFMNRTFRDDLRQLLKRIKNRFSGW